MNLDPIIFRALKSITQANSQQHTLLRLAQEGISVYSPHTAVDAAPGGLNDWLVDCLTVQVNAEEYTNPGLAQFHY
jgi:putative NIF3 family GTP cyclohydrolase 1 type 2